MQQIQIKQMDTDSGRFLFAVSIHLFLGVIPVNTGSV